MEKWHEEDIDVMYGVDIEEQPEEDGCCCGYVCMDCLGMSWRDFI